MGNYNYQMDHGNGYENVYPDNSLHAAECNDPECQGCWDGDDYDIWFKAIEDYDDTCIRARVLFSNQEMKERIYDQKALDEEIEAYAKEEEDEEENE